MPNLTAEEDNQWANRATESVAKAMSKKKVTQNLVMATLQNSDSPENFTTSLKGLLGTLWDNKAPNGESLESVEWSQIVAHVIENVKDLDENP